jgi:hypothetical protein
MPRSVGVGNAKPHIYSDGWRRGYWGGRYNVRFYKSVWQKTAEDAEKEYLAEVFAFTMNGLFKKRK